MQATPRRALLGALALAPVAGALAALPARASELPRDLHDLEGEELLRLGSSLSGEPRFSALCRVALEARQSEDAAWRLYHDANDAAYAAAPFPAALLMRNRFKRNDGTVEEWDEQWAPAKDKGGWALERLSQAALRAEGVTEFPNWGPIWRKRDELRAQWEAWSIAHQSACQAYLVGDLLNAAESASANACRALSAVLSHRTSSRHVMRLKLHLRSDDCRNPSDLIEWREVVADIERALI